MAYQYPSQVNDQPGYSHDYPTNLQRLSSSYPAYPDLRPHQLDPIEDSFDMGDMQCPPEMTHDGSLSWTPPPAHQDQHAYPQEEYQAYDRGHEPQYQGRRQHPDFADPYPQVHHPATTYTNSPHFQSRPQKTYPERDPQYIGNYRGHPYPPQEIFQGSQAHNALPPTPPSVYQDVYQDQHQNRHPQIAYQHQHNPDIAASQYGPNFQNKNTSSLQQSQNRQEQRAPSSHGPPKHQQDSLTHLSYPEPQASRPRPQPQMAPQLQPSQAPQVTPKPASPPSTNPRILELQETIAGLEAELNGQDPDAVIKEHIDLLHRYNEVKDTTQFLIGKLAILTRTTVVALHQEFDLPLRDL